jgi:hypothetical protein
LVNSNPETAARHERVRHANALIRLIAAHGMRIFLYPINDTYASIELDDRGVVWYIDDNSRDRINTLNPDWPGFTQTKMIRTLVEQMRDYILNGRQIDPFHLGCERAFGAGNKWGYDQASIDFVRSVGGRMPIIAKETAIELESA